MNRLKSYDVPHKGLRNALSQLSLLAGKTDYTDKAEVEAFYELGSDVFKILNVHAEDENEVTLAALETRCPGCAQHDMDDHERMHNVQDRLEQLLNDIHTKSMAGQDVTDAGAEFYLAFSEYQATYLEHTAEEERVTQLLLWQHFTDDELMAHRNKIMGKLQPQTLLIWFRFIAPAQTHAERVGLFSGFKKMAPPAFFDESMKVVQQVLEPMEYEKLASTLEQLYS